MRDVSSRTLCDGVCVQLDISTPEAVSELMRAIASIDDEITIQSVVDNSTDELTVSIALESITDAQLEAVTLAIERGYYDTPRRTDLGSLAEELGVGRSAVSQRLNSVERKVIKDLFGRFS